MAECSVPHELTAECDWTVPSWSTVENENIRMNARPKFQHQLHMTAAIGHPSWACFCFAVQSGLGHSIADFIALAWIQHCALNWPVEFAISRVSEPQWLSKVAEESYVCWLLSLPASHACKKERADVWPSQKNAQIEFIITGCTGKQSARLKHTDLGAWRCRKALKGIQWFRRTLRFIGVDFLGTLP